MDEVLLEKLESLAKPLAAKHEDEEMIQALEQLPADYAMPLRLRFFDEIPLNRIAAFMGVPLSTSETEDPARKETVARESGSKSIGRPVTPLGTNPDRRRHSSVLVNPTAYSRDS